MGYALPTNTSYVSCSWQCHKNRNPCSTEPGTDYGSAYGSPLYAPEAGTVVDLKTSNSGATGRYLTIDLNDGRRTRSLHLSAISVSIGQKVSRGQLVGKTGASGYGSDWGYGAHVHQTLWSTKAYNFCCTCTIDFALYVGGSSGGIGKTQRQVGQNPANGRDDPSTKGPVTQTLNPGTIADMNGWINGESVDGNKVWFRGMHSGDFFWSGGFTDKGTHDLANLNPPAMNADQRQATADVNGREEPNTTSPVTHSLKAGAIGTFDGWINGQTVEGEKRWLRGKSSQAYFSLKYLTPQNTTGLKDLNAPPPADTSRTVASPNAANVRAKPYTTSPAIKSENSGTVIPMKAWAEAESIDGNKVWFQRNSDSNWMWSGGFTSTSTTGLTKVTPPPPDGGGGGTDPDNPRDLEEYEPFYPRATNGLVAPMGFTDCFNPVTPMPRTQKGSPPVTTPALIDRFIIHHTATTVDQLDWFSYCNSRAVCPTYYLRTDGSSFEMIRPGVKPAATGPNWNYRSIAVETLNKTGAPEWTVTDAQVEELAQMIAWLSTFDGKMLDGCPVSFKIDRTHVISHQEALPGTTECPGPYLQTRMNQIVDRARVIAGEGPDPDPCADCPPECMGDCPECPECPDCPPGDGVLDPAEYPTLFALYGELGRAFGEEGR